MRVIGVGTDIVDARRIARAYARFGIRFARRILAPTEWSQFEDSSRPEVFLARRFAAKEAVCKAIGTGMRGSVDWRRIEVLHGASGQPLVRLPEAFVPVGTEIHISLADERHYATATAFAVRA